MIITNKSIEFVEVVLAIISEGIKKMTFRDYPKVIYTIIPVIDSIYLLIISFFTVVLKPYCNARKYIPSSKWAKL